MTLGYFDCSTNISETSNGFIKVWRYTNTCEIDGMNRLISPWSFEAIDVKKSKETYAAKKVNCRLWSI
jgi:hypothetical protein